eukprot:6190251-Pleurochrysis_carterae.AAC.2
MHGWRNRRKWGRQKTRRANDKISEGVSAHQVERDGAADRVIDERREQVSKVVRDPGLIPVLSSAQKRARVRT